MPIIDHKAKVDFFATNPLIHDKDSGSIGANFNDLGKTILPRSHFDQVAFWECLIWDCCLCERTLDSRVIHVTPEVITNREAGASQLNRGSDILLKNRTSGVSEFDILRAISNRLTELCEGYWASLGENERLLLPLSGGLDSRLVAAHLTSTGDPNRIVALSFAHSPKSLDFLYAKKVSEILGIPHALHSLSPSMYEQFTTDFWTYWHGALSVMHTHLYSALANHSGTKLMISGFYADAVAGYACTAKSPFVTHLENSQAYLKLIKKASAFDIPKEIVAEIISDLGKIWQQWTHCAPIIDFDEYFYFSQRQPKTFSLLAELYRHYLPTAFPFADELIIDLFLQVPPQLRKAKLVMRRLINMKAPSLKNVPDVSSAFLNETLRDKIKGHIQRNLGRITYLLPRLTGDQIYWISPFMTENLDQAFRVIHYNRILNTAQRLHELDLISAKLLKIVKTKSFYEWDSNLAARLLTLSEWEELQ